MTLPPPGKKLKQNHPSLQHPNAIKLDMRLSKLDALLDNIFVLADGDILVSNAETGLTDFSINEKFAKKLEDASKLVAGLANQLNEKAAIVLEKLDEARDRKVQMQDIVHVEDVTDFKKKCDAAKQHPRTKFVPSQDFRIKTEWISDDSGDKQEAKQQANFSGETDGHFAFPKTNENPAETHSFICEHCQGVFHDRHELCNHYTNHRLEFLQCLVCDQIYRSVHAFQVHNESHDKLHVCLVCCKGFKLKTTLTNHAQVHSDKRLHCSVSGCDKFYKHRQNQVEHVRWGHRDKKECPCTIYGKLFQTPTNMRTRRLRQHRLAHELIPGYPVTEHNKKCTAKQQASQAAKKGKTELASKVKKSKT